MIAITISSCSYYYNYAKTNQTEEQQQLADLMVARGMKQGYGGYWIANELTEFSNGELEFWLLTPDNMTDPRYTLKWLQDQIHFDTKPAGKVFYLLTRQEYDDNNVSDKLGIDKAVIGLPDYLVFEFDNVSELFSALGVYN